MEEGCKSKKHKRHFPHSCSEVRAFRHYATVQSLGNNQEEIQVHSGIRDRIMIMETQQKSMHDWKKDC